MIANLAATLQSLGSPRILVVGDLILDRYTWGNAERVSPEAPVLVLDADTREVRLGGAASVAALLRGLDVHVTLAGVLGDDPAGLALRELFERSAIDHRLTVSDPSRPTTTKERFIGRAAGRHPHQILRVDSETREPLSSELADRLARSILAQLADHQALLISDYHKGVCTRQLLEPLLAAARARGLPVLVDPARISDYSRYRGATLLAPNRAEAALAAGQAIRTPDDALAAGHRLRQACGAGAVIVKLDSDGMVLAGGAGADQHVPARLRPVHDVTGAGDMVLAVLGLCQSAGVPLLESLHLANAAAGLEVERLGVAPVTRAEILAGLGNCSKTLGIGEEATFRWKEAGHPERSEGSPSNPDQILRFAQDDLCESPTVVSSPILGEPCASARRSLDPGANAPGSPVLKRLVTLDEMHRLADSYRRAGRTIVFTNGCFDLLHIGHAAYLEEARRLGDVLVVAVNSDRSVRAIKGPQRPIIPQEDRATLVAALACVDHVLIFDQDTPHELLRRIRPDVLVKGGTYAPQEVVGREVVESYGGRVTVTDSIPAISTTAILASVLSASALPLPPCSPIP